MCKHNMSLSSFQREMTALFPQGRVAFGNFVEFPAYQSRICERSLKVRESESMA
jgi:hypothetical protein